ncbi:FAD-binding domain-containing protein [Gloeopeniophorella convolvens]|nr:FAD-binding domain-containing protein [Gloeopeniophorella convolvens]
MQFAARQSRSRLGHVGRAAALRNSLPRSASRRLLSTAAGSSSGSSSNGLAIALGTALVGFGAYYAGSLKDGSGSVSANNAKPVYGSQEDFKKAIKELETTFTEEGVVSTDPANLKTHGFSPNVMHEGVAHSVVVYPETTEDVVKVVKIANKYRMPVVPYAGGTSLEGHFIGHEGGGICIDLSGMNKILEIHARDSDMVCQTGVDWMEINATLKEKDIPLFFPIDPGPSATIGGMLSTGCSGTNAVRYGTAKGEWFLNATVVLPSGEVIKTRQRARKSSAGFDVTKLFIGAEGTLGIVTEVTIRLAPVIPSQVAIAQFPNVKSATEAVIDILNSGVNIQCIELLDSAFMHATNVSGATGNKYEETDHLFFKLQGATPNAIDDAAKIVQQIVKKHGGAKFKRAKTQEEGDLIWQDRKNALFTALAYAGSGAKGWLTDVCVPVSNLPQLIEETQKDIEAQGIKYLTAGHAGDGNFHSLLTFRNEEELNIVRDLVHRMVERAIRLDGTCTGEHGVGIGKKEFLIEELGEGTVNLMKTIKRAVDPHWLFNPGKVRASAIRIRRHTH